MKVVAFIEPPPGDVIENPTPANPLDSPDFRA
jgi:hypothetical protein